MEGALDVHGRGLGHILSMSTARFGTRGVLEHYLSGIGDCWLVRDFGIYVQRGGAASERGRVRAQMAPPQVVMLADFRDLCVQCGGAALERCRARAQRGHRRWSVLVAWRFDGTPLWLSGPCVCTVCVCRVCSSLSAVRHDAHMNKIIKQISARVIDKQRTTPERDSRVLAPSRRASALLGGLEPRQRRDGLVVLLCRHTRRFGCGRHFRRGAACCWLCGHTAAVAGLWLAKRG